VTEKRVVQVSQLIDSTPEAIFRALTQPLDLTLWFCHHAWMDPQPGGEYQVRWRNGWRARGIFQMVERPRRIELSWQGKDEPGETTVVFEIHALDKGADLSVIHSGYGSNAIWNKAVAEAQRSWPRALENLQSVLTTGIDLRRSGRPMLGIVPETLIREAGVGRGIRGDGGVYVAEVLEEGGAVTAGLERGDVITSVDGLAVTDWDALLTILATSQPGDYVQVGYVRRGRRNIVAIELAARPTPEVSFDLQEMVNQMQAMQVDTMRALRQALKGVTDELAGQNPTADEWSVREILAHLSLNERIRQHWLADVILGTTPGQSGGDAAAVPEALNMVLTTTPTVEELLARLQQDMEETLALFASLRPELVAMRGRYRAMADSLLLGLHIQNHIDQIESTLKAAKSKAEHS
jgi:uncharacterized protein YndB with AHSA1/START domain